MREWGRRIHQAHRNREQTRSQALENIWVDDPFLRRGTGSVFEGQDRHPVEETKDPIGTPSSAAQVRNGDLARSSVTPRWTEGPVGDLLARIAS